MKKNHVTLISILFPFFLPRFVSGGKIDRFSALYRLTDNGTFLILDKPKTSALIKLPTLCSGGGGLVSTASDYTRFSRMLLNKGELEGIRLLDRETVDLMTTNQLSDNMLPISPIFPGQGFGLGFGVIVNVPDSGGIGSEGEFKWQGVYNTFFWVDPKEDMILILMAQYSPFLYFPVDKEFIELVYRAIVEKR